MYIGKKKRRKEISEEIFISFNPAIPARIYFDLNKQANFCLKMIYEHNTTRKMQQDSIRIIHLIPECIRSLILFFLYLEIQFVTMKNNLRHQLIEWKSFCRTACNYHLKKYSKSYHIFPIYNLQFYNPRLSL